MQDLTLYGAFATYNQWMNEKLYATCADIDDDTRKADRGAFFGSLHSTLNHLLFGDRAWMGRFTGKAYTLAPMGADLYADFDELRSERAAMDRDILDWTAGLTDDWLQGDLTWVSGADNIERSRPRWICVSHMFNHQTHHRGQAHCLLTQLGHDIGPTDLPWTPTLGFD